MEIVVRTGPIHLFRAVPPPPNTTTHHALVVQAPKPLQGFLCMAFFLNSSFLHALCFYMLRTIAASSNLHTHNPPLPTLFGPVLQLSYHCRLKRPLQKHNWNAGTAKRVGSLWLSCMCEGLQERSSAKVRIRALVWSTWPHQQLHVLYVFLLKYFRTCALTIFPNAGPISINLAFRSDDAPSPWPWLLKTLGVSN